MKLLFGQTDGRTDGRNGFCHNYFYQLEKNNGRCRNRQGAYFLQDKIFFIVNGELKITIFVVKVFLFINTRLNFLSGHVQFLTESLESGHCKLTGSILVLKAYHLPRGQGLNEVSEKGKVYVADIICYHIIGQCLTNL